MNRLLGRRTFKAARPILRNYYAAFTSASSSASSGLKPTCGGYDTWALPDLDPEADYTLVEELETSYDIQSELLNMRIHKLLDKYSTQFSSSHIRIGWEFWRNLNVISLLKNMKFRQATSLLNGVSPHHLLSIVLMSNPLSKILTFKC